MLPCSETALQAIHPFVYAFLRPFVCLSSFLLLVFLSVRSSVRSSIYSVCPFLSVSSIVSRVIHPSLRPSLRSPPSQSVCPFISVSSTVGSVIHPSVQLSVRPSTHFVSPSVSASSTVGRVILPSVYPSFHPFISSVCRCRSHPQLDALFLRRRRFWVFPVVRVSLDGWVRLSDAHSTKTRWELVNLNQRRQ